MKCRGGISSLDHNDTPIPHKLPDEIPCGTPFVGVPKGPKTFPPNPSSGLPATPHRRSGRRSISANNCGTNHPIMDLERDGSPHSSIWSTVSEVNGERAPTGPSQPKTTSVFAKRREAQRPAARRPSMKSTAALESFSASLTTSPTAVSPGSEGTRGIPQEKYEIRLGTPPEGRGKAGVDGTLLEPGPAAPAASRTVRSGLNIPSPGMLCLLQAPLPRCSVFKGHTSRLSSQSGLSQGAAPRQEWFHRPQQVIPCVYCFLISCSLATCC